MRNSSETCSTSRWNDLRCSRKVVVTSTNRGRCLATLLVRRSGPTRDAATTRRGLAASLPDHLYQVTSQRLQVRLVAQLHRKPFERLGRVILPSIEAAIY